jgi:hypothetical protein
MPRTIAGRATIILGASIVVRLAVALVHSYFGVNSIPYLPEAFPWGDFDTIYAWQLRLLSSGLLPYRDFAYSYPPLFLYSLLPLYSIGGQSLASLPVWLSDAGTSIIIFYLARNHNQKIAFAAAMVYALCPFALYYEGYLWLSSQPFTFFTLLSLLLLKEKRTTLATGSIAVAILFKQQAIAFLPFFVAMRFWATRKRLATDGLLFVGIVLAVLAPFLVVSFQQTLASITYGLIGNGSPVLTGPTLAQTSSAPTTCHLLSLNAQYPTIAACGGTSPNLSLLQEQLQNLQLFSTLAKVGGFLALPIFLISSLAILVSRKSENFSQLLWAWSNVGFLLLFQDLVHPSLAYYLLPSYALVLASSCNIPSLTVAGLVPLISLSLPEGGIQIVLVSMDMILVSALQRVPASASVESPRRPQSPLDPPLKG